MSKATRRHFVASTLAAGAAAIGAGTGQALADGSAPGAQPTRKEKLNFVVETGNIGGGSLEEAIQYAKDLGIPAISVPWVRVPGFKDNGVLDVDRVKAIRAQIEQAGFTVHSMMASLSRDVLSGGATADTQFAALRQNFQAMAAARIDLLAAFVPARKDAPWDQLVAFYRRLMKELEPTGIRFATHSSGAFITYASMARLLQEAPSPNNGFCFCTGNVWHGEGEKIYDIPPQLAARFFYVHMRNVKTGQGEKEYWFDEGDISIPKMVGALRRIGYRGGIRSEHLPTDHYGQPRESDVGTAWAQGYMRAVQQLA